MKRCPKCTRTYSDDTFSFCLADGTLLSASLEAERTLVIQSTSQTKKKSQRDVMRGLVRRYGMNEDKVVHEYAEAEKRGEVERKNNSHNFTPEQYARALWNDGVKKGWLKSS